MGLKIRKLLLKPTANLAHHALSISLLLMIGFHAGISDSSAAKRTNPGVVISLVKSDTVIHEVRLSGTVISPRVASLSMEVSGLIKNINVDAGSVVSAGDTLMTLDTEREELSLQVAAATMLAASEELADAQRRLKDGQRLAKKKTMSANDLKSLEAEVDIAQAKLQRFSAEQQLKKLRLKQHKLKAPFNGVISQKLVEVGEWIQPGEAVVKLVANNNLSVDFQVPQQEFAKIKPSTEILIRIDSIPDKVIQGVIQAIVPFSDSDARTFLLRVSLPDDHPAIVPGMSASGLVRLNTESRGLVVPRDAILRYPDGRITAWVVNNREGKLIATERQIKIGRSFDGKVSILDGLKVDEQVIIEGNESLKNGQTVTLHKP